MEQKQIDRLEMYQATDEYLDAQSAVWSAIPIIGTYKNTLTQLIVQIKEAAKAQDAAQVFIGASIRQLKRQIADKMDILDDTLEAYAEDKEDATLKSQSDNSASDYYRLPNEAFETQVKNTISLLETHVGDMADYGMSTAQLDDVKLNFNEFESRIGKPRAYQVASSIATQELSELFKEGTKVTDKLDRVLKRYKRSNASFYRGYLAARSIVDS